MSLSDRIATGTKATFAAKVISLVADALVLLLLTRVFLSPDEFGLLFLAISIFSVATLFATLGIGKSAARYVADYREKNDRQVRHVVYRSLAFLSITTAVVCLVVVGFSSLIADFFGEHGLQPLLLIGGFYIAGKVVSSYLNLSFQGFGRVPLSAVKTIVTKVSELAFITLFLLLGFGTVGALWGFVLGLALGAAVGGYFLYRLLQQYPSDESIESGLSRRIAEYSVPLTATQSANVLYKRVDTLMVGFFLSPVAVAFYELAKQISMAVQAPASSLGFTVAPTYSEHKSTQKLETAARVYEQSFEYVLALYIPLITGMVILAEPGIQYVFGQDYVGAAPVLMVFSGFVLFQAIDKITNDSLDYLGRARERAIGKGVTGVLNFGLNLVLIPTIGIVGAASATVFCFGLMVAYNMYLMNKEVPLNLSRMFKSGVLTAAVSLIMAIVVVLLAPFIDGMITLLMVVFVGVVVWGILSIVSGLVDVGKVLSHV